MGEIVGAALVSHHPGLMQDKEFRIQTGNGRDSDLIEGFERLRARIDALSPDVLVIFDTHWFTTGYQLVDAGEHYVGTYISDEMPWYLHGQHYDYQGAPELAFLCENVGNELGVSTLAIDAPNLPRHYGTINVVNRLKAHQKVLSVSTCQNCRSEHFLGMGQVVGEAIRRSDCRAVLLASGALSHKFNDIYAIQRNERIFHPDNISSTKNYQSDLEAIALLREGEHQTIIERFPAVYSKLPWEGMGGHYLQMVGALGGSECKAKGEPLSEYENARGTGNVHIWFDLHRQNARVSE